jgi:hypothetical protein
VGRLVISAARKKTNREWRERNRETMRELSKNFYYRNREFVLWKMRLGTLLMSVVRGHEKKAAPND